VRYGLTLLFFGVVLCVFAGGFGKKRAAELGFLMVNLWWIRGETWSIDGHFFDAKIFLGFEIYFLRVPFWEMPSSLHPTLRITREEWGTRPFCEIRPAAGERASF
jgi:hypothetical protein